MAIAIQGGPGKMTLKDISNGPEWVLWAVFWLFLMISVNVNIKMIKKWKIKMYICQELFLSLCFHKGPFLFQTV